MNTVKASPTPLLRGLITNMSFFDKVEDTFIQLGASLCAYCARRHWTNAFDELCDQCRLEMTRIVTIRERQTKVSDSPDSIVSPDGERYPAKLWGIPLE